MNDMRSTSKQTESQDLFKELVGDEVVFFNKDMGTENVFNSRTTSLDHSDECDCLDCESERDNVK